jgi:hypothetical protein
MEILHGFSFFILFRLSKLLQFTLKACIYVQIMEYLYLETVMMKLIHIGSVENFETSRKSLAPLSFPLETFRSVFRA